MELKEDLQQKLNSLNDIYDCMTIFVKADKDDSCRRREQFKEIHEMLRITSDLQKKFHQLKPAILYEAGERHQRLISEWQKVQSESLELVEENKRKQKEATSEKVQCNEVTPNKHFLCVPTSTATMKTPLSVLKQSTSRMLLSAYKESPLIRKIRPVSICFDDFSFQITQVMFNSIPK